VCRYPLFFEMQCVLTRAVGDTTVATPFGQKLISQYACLTLNLQPLNLQPFVVDDPSGNIRCTHQGRLLPHR